MVIVMACMDFVHSPDIVNAGGGGGCRTHTVDSFAPLNCEHFGVKVHLLTYIFSLILP